MCVLGVCVYLGGGNPHSGSACLTIVFLYPLPLPPPLGNPGPHIHHVQVRDEGASSDKEMAIQLEKKTGVCLEGEVSHSTC